MPSGFKNSLQRIKRKRAEQQVLLEQLALWNVVSDAGIDVDTVKAFTFRPEFLTPVEKKLERRWGNPRPGAMRGPFSSGGYFNCVRLKSSELVPIPLTKRPTELAEEADDHDQPGEPVSIPCRAPHSESRS